MLKAICTLKKYESFVVKNIVNTLYKTDCVYVRNNKSFQSCIEDKGLIIKDTIFWNPIKGIFSGTELSSVEEVKLLITWTIYICVHKYNVRVKDKVTGKWVIKPCESKRAIICPFN